MVSIKINILKLKKLIVTDGVATFLTAALTTFLVMAFLTELVPLVDLLLEGLFVFFLAAEALTTDLVFWVFVLALGIFKYIFWLIRRETINTSFFNYI